MSRTLRSKVRYALRNHRHLPEKREVSAALEQGVPVRAKRRVRRLPNPWDDKPVAALYEQDFKK